MNTILAILDAVINTLWQAVAVAALVWAALRFMPRMNAATRHAIWWATLAIVLVLPVVPRLTAMLRPHRHPAEVTATPAPKATSPAVTIEPLIVPIAPGRTARWPLAVLAVWSAIFLWRTFQILRSYFYLRGIKRRSAISPMPLPAIPRRATLLISPDIISPMAVGFLRPAVVLPESLLAELTEPERDHVLLHESAHLARHDDWANLAMRILGGVLALHPVAIWILRRIEREREMACDDWVVARIGSARPYAASLARMVELRQARRGQMLASGILGSGSRIGDRIELLLRHGRTFSPRASAGGVVASALVLSGLMLTGSLAPRWIAFAQQPRLAFEVTSIKPNTMVSEMVKLGPPVGGRFTATNVSLKMLVMRAWKVKNFEISGGPGWIDSARYDVAATAAESNIAEDQFKAMLQALIRDRFKFEAHRESKEMPIYALLPVRNGSKLPEATGSCVIPQPNLPPPPPAPGQPPPVLCGGFLMDGSRLEGRKISMAQRLTPPFPTCWAAPPVIDRNRIQRNVRCPSGVHTGRDRAARRRRIWRARRPGGGCRRRGFFQALYLHGTATATGPETGIAKRPGRDPRHRSRGEA